MCLVVVERVWVPVADVQYMRQYTRSARQRLHSFLFGNQNEKLPAVYVSCDLLKVLSATNCMPMRKNEPNPKASRVIHSFSCTASKPDVRLWACSVKKISTCSKVRSKSLSISVVIPSSNMTMLKLIPTVLAITVSLPLISCQCEYSTKLHRTEFPQIKY